MIRNEAGRLAALEDLQILDGGPEEIFDRIATLARNALGFPLSYVSIVNLDQQVLKSCAGPIRDCARATAFCASTIEAEDTLVVVDAREHAVFRDFPQVVGPPFVRAYWGTPLTTRAGYKIGALCVLDHVPRRPSDAELLTLREFGRLTVDCIELRAQASVDVLTGVKTRRAFFSEGQRVFAAMQETGPLSCIVLDLDHFKGINDALGHGVGDEVLRRLGRLLRAELGVNRIAGRIGGEEFAILLPGEGIEAAIAFAERVRLLLPDQTRPLCGDCTASFGVAERDAGDLTLDELLGRADRAVYRAKSGGRDTTRVARDRYHDQARSAG